MTTAMAAHRTGIAKVIVDALRKHFSTKVTFDVCVPSDFDEVKKDIFFPQHWSQSERHMSVGMTPYGLQEVRYLLFGVQLNKLKGTTVKEKLD